MNNNLCEKSCINSVRLFEAVKAGQFVGYTSKYVTDELKKAEEPKRSNMLALVEEYGITSLVPHPKSEAFAEYYRNAGLIPKSQVPDSLHVATASLYRLDAIVSYNFHHINKLKTQKFIPFVNRLHDLGHLMFCTAEEVFYLDGLKGLEKAF